MKKLIAPVVVSCLIVLMLSSCKKCVECTTKVSQTVLGITTSTSTSEEYCGDEYDNAPEESTVSNNLGSVVQTVEVTCKDS